MVVLKMLGMKMVKLLSVIKHCVHCSHLNQNISLNVTRSCVVVNVEFLLRVYIHHFYPGLIGIWKNSRIKSKILKSEGLVRKHIKYIQHIKIHWCHMGVIFMPKDPIWQMQQCAHILSLIMHCYTGNVYDQSEDKRTLSHFPYQMLWHKYDAQVASLYFYMCRICGVLSHQTFWFEHFGFYPSVFQTLITPG